MPNVGVERDLEQFVEYFENPMFRSDGLKIYPTLVIRGTGLYELWRTGRYVTLFVTALPVALKLNQNNNNKRYENYTPNALIDIVARILALVPPWTRIYRVQRSVTKDISNICVKLMLICRLCRDIPMPLVSSGVENGNLRELALTRMKDFGAKCRDVRNREVGIHEIHHKVSGSKVSFHEKKS